MLHQTAQFMGNGKNSASASSKNSPKQLSGEAKKYLFKTKLGDDGKIGGEVYAHMADGVNDKLQAHYIIVLCGMAIRCYPNDPRNICMAMEILIDRAPTDEKPKAALI